MPDSGAKRSRVLVIGLDGATFDLLLPWLEDESLPHLAELWSHSSFARLRTTIPPITASAWTSFQTGKNPGKHGLFDFTQYRPGSYETPFVNARSVQAEPLWVTLSRHGKRVVVLNVPVTYPPRAVNGYMISGLLTPSTKVEFTYPPGLYQELVDAIEDYVVLVPVRDFLRLGLDGFVDRLTYVSRQRARAAEYLMGRLDWDFFMVHFHAPDVLQHALWSHLDPSHPAYGASPEADRRRVSGYYQEMDKLVGSLLREAGPGVTTVIMSDHGFGPALKRFHVNQWLAREGLLTVRADSLRKKTLDGFERALRRIDPHRLRWRLIAPFSKRETLIRRFTQESLIDWASTRAYAVPSSAVMRLQVNCVGREPAGIVQPGAEYEAVCEEIAQRLKEVRDPQTGTQVVEHVFRREEIYSGPALDLMPDLVAQPAGGYQIATRFQGDALFSALPAGFTGNHRMEGVLLLAGPDVVPGQMKQQPHIVDLFPTILSLLDVPLPPDLDGNLLTEALSQEYLAAHPPRWEESGPSAPPPEEQDQTYSEADTKEIKDRLKGFGYLD